MDGFGYLDTKSLTGLNLYSYCRNNPILGYDPEGTWNRKKFWCVFAAVAIVSVVAFAAIATALAGAATIVITKVAVATIVTAVEVYIAAATKSVVALDFSFSLGKNLNGKGGATILLDFENERTEMYTHRGVYLGNSIGLGLNYTASFVGNYNKKGGYAGPFIFAGATYNGYGVDYCFGSKKSDAYGIGVTIGTGEEIGWYGGYDEYKYCGGFDW